MKFLINITAIYNNKLIGYVISISRANPFALSVCHIKKFKKLKESQFYEKRIELKNVEFECFGTKNCPLSTKNWLAQSARMGRMQI